MGPPPDHRIPAGIIVWKIVFRYIYDQPFGQIPFVFLFQGERIIFQVSGNKDLFIVFREDDVGSTYEALC